MPHSQMSERRRVAVVGAGPHAKVALDIFAAARQCDVIGVLDDDAAKKGVRLLGVEVLGSVSWGLETLPSDVAFFVAIGGNGPRQRVIARCSDTGRRLTNAVHPSAVVSAGAVLHSNVMACANSVIGVEVVVSDGAVINTSVSVDHESVLGLNAYLAPGSHTAGRVRIGREAFVGVGTTIGPGVTIGDHAVIGAGSLVLGDVPERVYAWGRPARVIKPVEKDVDWRALLGGQSRS